MSRGKRRRIAQLDPPQPKDDSLREVISSRMTARPNWQRQGGFASLMQEISPGMNASDAPTVDELLHVAEGSVEFLFGTSRAALLQISSPLSTTESKAWLSSQNVDAKLAKLGRSMPQALKNTLYFYSFQKPCEELLRKATLDPAEAADWAYYSGRWYLSDASDHCVTKAEFVAVQASARTLLQQLEAAQSISNSSPAPAMPFGLAVDGKKLMSRFFQLRGGWVQGVASRGRLRRSTHIGGIATDHARRRGRRARLQRPSDSGPDGCAAQRRQRRAVKATTSHSEPSSPLDYGSQR